MKMLRVHFCVAEISCGNMSPGVTTPILGWFCSRDVSHEVQLPGTRRCNILYPWDMYPQTFSCVCTSDFRPCYMSPLHVPNACRFSVYYTPFCRCKISLQHDPSILPTLNINIFVLFNMHLNFFKDGVFLPRFIIYQKCTVTPIFLLGYQEYLLGSTFSG